MLNLLNKNNLTYFKQITENSKGVLKSLLTTLEVTNEKLNDYISDEIDIINKHHANVSEANNYIFENINTIDFIKDFLDEN